MARSGLLRVLAATAAVTAAAGIAAASAPASWPGQNGRILFSAVEDMAPEPPLARAADCANAHFTFLTSVAADGTDPRLVAPGGILPAVLPAGALAYFDVGTDCNGYMSTPDIPLRVREPGGGERTVLTLHDFRFVDPDTTRLAWDRPGRALTYSRRGRIMSIDARSGVSHLVTKGSGATWSSGDELAFTRRRARGPASRLLAMSGRSVRTLTTADATAPDWSPDGRWIAFARRSFHRGEVRRSAVYVIGRDGRGLRRVTADSVRLALTPVWSPDGRWIAFIRVRASGSTLMVVPSDGTGEARAVIRRVVQPAQLAWEALPEAAEASGRTARADTVGTLTRIAWPLKITVGGLPGGCLRRRATVHVETTVAPTDRLTGIRATIDGRTVARDRRAAVRFAVRPRGLEAGRHRLGVVATTAQGERRSARRGFRVCR